MDGIIKQLLPLITQVIGSVFKSGNSSPLGKVAELGALANFLKDLPGKFAGNDLIGGLVKGLADFDFKGMDIGGLNVGDVLGKLGGLDDILKGAGDAGGPVKGIVYEMAEKVAGAGGGGLLGGLLGGNKVSEGEAKFLADLKSKLGL